MEQNNPDSPVELQVDHESRNSFKQAAKWSSFIAVMYIICFGLLVIVGLLVIPALLNPNSAINEEFERQGTKLNAITMYRMAAVTIFLIYAGLMAIRFGTYARRGVEMQDRHSFNHGLKGLRNYFIAGALYGIWTFASQVFEFFTTIA